MNKCKLISLDTSSNSTGYSIFLNAKYSLSGTLTPEKGLSGQEKLDNMCRKIAELLSKESPDIVIIERMSVGRNVRTARILSEIIGVVYGWCLANNQVYYEEITPAQWRSELGLPTKSNELKQTAIDFVSSKGIYPGTNDEADAICIGMAYISKIDKLQ